MKIFRKPIFVIVFAGIGCLLAQVQSKPLQVARQGNRLVVSAPQLHFIVGKPLEQLHNGASVTYLFSVTLTGADPIRIRQRFVLSYDLWEEKFSVLQSDASGRSASHLTAAAAETWCLENLSIPVPQFRPDRPFAVKLECTVEAPEITEHDPGLTLAGLVDVFSRKRPEQTPHWEATSGTLRMSDVKDKSNQGSKGRSNLQGTAV